jgi:DUF1680 family protein
MIPLVPLARIILPPMLRGAVMNTRLLSLILLVALAASMGADFRTSTDLTSPDNVRLTGIWSEAQTRNVERMAAAPLDKPEFILDDVALVKHRKFAEYSGDISGRWIGAAAFLAPQFPKPFALLPTILAEIPNYQNNDGHFGVDQHLPEISRTRDMPILWGNGRLLIGLVEVYQRTGDQNVLKTAKKLGDYFVSTDSVYNKPDNLKNVGGTYSDGFATCYFSCIEGLVGLGRATQDERYLDAAKRIAELAFSVDDFTGLHSHGRLCAVRGFADLYAATGDAHWREAAERDWTIFRERCRLPTGGIKEVLSPKCNADEGCSVCDWLRLNLSLSRLTGQQRYLDEAERCLKGHFLYQQFPNGGAGHRLFYQIGGQPVAFKGLREEAWWCCGEHWARAMVDVACSAVTAGEEGPCVNLAIDCQSAVAGLDGTWNVTVHETEDGLRVIVKSPTATKATVRIHRPEWAKEGARIEKPAGLSLIDAEAAWLIEGVWDGRQEIVVHLPATLRSEPAPGDAGVLLRGHDLLVAHRVPANAWLMERLAIARPVVLWAAAMPAKDGRIVVPASDVEDADPNNPAQWKLIELAPLRALTGQPHEAAWFSFRLRPATIEQITALTAKIR